ncbi:hypothetical protein RND81_03G187500 [Saponaria officinalis]|uniref:Mitochondrial import receptor subunit TOM6 homolog n=1 Tax=Saponaria officinalis TaxID=3572 RepID=A0AAW1M1D6_SAPOF
MFGGMFRKKPSKAAAMKELRTNAAYFAVFVAAVRVTPYLLSYFQKDELLLDL